MCYKHQLVQHCDSQKQSALEMEGKDVQEVKGWERHGSYEAAVLATVVTCGNRVAQWSANPFKPEASWKDIVSNDITHCATTNLTVPHCRP